MTHAAWRRDGKAVDATTIPAPAWEALKLTSQLGDFVLPCCRAPAVLKTSINGLPFFAHLSDECATAPETKWHKEGKAAVLAALATMGIVGREEVSGRAPNGATWEADVLFTHAGRTIAIELQRSYQHLRDYTRRQERYAASSVDCFWLVRREGFLTLARSANRVRQKREPMNRNFGTSMLPELPVAWLDFDLTPPIQFGLLKSATVPQWLRGILAGEFRYREGSWHLG